MFTLLGGIRVILLGLNGVRVTLEKGMPPVATHLYQIWYKFYASVELCKNVFGFKGAQLSFQHKTRAVCSLPYSETEI